MRAHTHTHVYMEYACVHIHRVQWGNVRGGEVVCIRCICMWAPVWLEVCHDDVVLLLGLQAVKLTSTKTQLPYEYYSLPFCQPEEGIIYKTENLGTAMSLSFVMCVWRQLDQAGELVLVCLLDLLNAQLSPESYRQGLMSQEGEGGGGGVYT